MRERKKRLVYTACACTANSVIPPLLIIINPRRMRERVTVLGLSFVHSFIHSFCPSSYRDQRSLLRAGKVMSVISTTMACNLTRGFC